MQLARDQTLQDLRTKTRLFAGRRRHPHPALSPFKMQARVLIARNHPYHAQLRLRLRQGAELDRIRDKLVDQEAHELRRLGVQPNLRALNNNSRSARTMDEQLIEHQRFHTTPAAMGVSATRPITPTRPARCKAESSASSWICICT